MPTRNIFGWQKPCYLLGEGYADSYAELMEMTEWDKYGTGKYEKCANCMAHCGYEPTAAVESAANPLKTAWVFLWGPKTEGVMAPEISLANQRKAEDNYENLVEERVVELERTEENRKELVGTAA